jgi:hypothetical protein
MKLWLKTCEHMPFMNKSILLDEKILLYKIRKI